MGQPPKPIDWTEFEKLCFIHCTQGEIASFFNICSETLLIRAEENYGVPFAQVYARFSDGGKCSLRRTQLQLAQKNVAMAIWLGKQWLGQRDFERMEENKSLASATAKAFVELLDRSRDLTLKPKVVDEAEVECEPSLEALDAEVGGEKDISDESKEST